MKKLLLIILLLLPCSASAQFVYTGTTSPTAIFNGTIDTFENSEIMTLNAPAGDRSAGIHIAGTYTSGLTLDGILVSTDPTIQYFFAFNDNSRVYPQTAAQGAWSYGAGIQAVGSTNMSKLYGFISQPWTSGYSNQYSGTIDEMAAYEAIAQVDSGAVNSYSLFNGFVYSKQGTIGNMYGLKLPDITAGTSTNYAIKTGQGKVSFGDKLTVNSGPSATSTVTVGELNLTSSKSCVNMNRVNGQPASFYVSADAKMLVVEPNYCR